MEDCVIRGAETAAPPSTIWPQLRQYLSVIRTSLPHLVQNGKVADGVSAALYRFGCNLAN